MRYPPSPTIALLRQSVGSNSVAGHTYSCYLKYTYLNTHTRVFRFKTDWLRSLPRYNLTRRSLSTRLFGARFNYSIPAIYPVDAD